MIPKPPTKGIPMPSKRTEAKYTSDVSVSASVAIEQLPSPMINIICVV